MQFLLLLLLSLVPPVLLDIFVNLQRLSLRLKYLLLLFLDVASHLLLKIVLFIDVDKLILEHFNRIEVADFPGLVGLSLLLLQFRDFLLFLILNLVHETLLTLI